MKFDPKRICAGGAPFSLQSSTGQGKASDIALMEFIVAAA